LKLAACLTRACWLCGADSCDPADRVGGRPIPVIIWIWATKDFAVALPLTIYLLIVGLADNVLKPMLWGAG
jgi:hypothetical protein